MSSSTAISSFASPRQQYSVNCHGRSDHHHHHHHVVIGGLSCLPCKPFSANQAARYLHSFSNINLNRLQPKRTTNMKVNAIKNVPGGTPLPSPPPGPNPFSGWSNWLLLTVIPMLLPFFKSKWGPLLQIKKEVDTAIQAVECAVEVVEDVAKKMEEVVEEVEEKLPEGSELKDKLRTIEHAAQEAIKGADLAEDLIHKAKEAEKKVDGLMGKVDHQGQKVAPQKSPGKK